MLVLIPRGATAVAMGVIASQLPLTSVDGDNSLIVLPSPHPDEKGRAYGKSGKIDHRGRVTFRNGHDHIRFGRQTERWPCRGNPSEDDERAAVLAEVDNLSPFT